MLTITRQVADYTMVPETARMADIPRVCLQVVIIITIIMAIILATIIFTITTTIITIIIIIITDP